MGQAQALPISTEWPDSTSSDGLLVQSAQTNRAAFEPLYDRYFDAIYRFCFFRLGDSHRAEDATSEVFTKALANLSQFRYQTQEDGFRCWIFAIARHVVTDHHRDHARHPSDPLDLAEGVLDEAPTPEEVALDADSHHQVLALLARLKPNQRDLLELRLAGLKNAEIARILGRTHDSVRKEQSRIVHLLRTFADLDAGREVSHG
jgi:RNA polymerase sigma-70 factor (ECF subfamily)